MKQDRGVRLALHKLSGSRHPLHYWTRNSQSRTLTDFSLESTCTSKQFSLSVGQHLRANEKRIGTSWLLCILYTGPQLLSSKQLQCTGTDDKAEQHHHNSSADKHNDEELNATMALLQIVEEPMFRAAAGGPVRTVSKLIHDQIRGRLIDHFDSSPRRMTLHGQGDWSHP
jgi:hypothetical protein